MERVKILFINHRLVCGGAEQALFDLALMMDPERFDVTILSQNPGGSLDQKFHDAGIHLIYDYSCRKSTMNPVTKAGNVLKKLRTDSAYRHGGAGLLDVILPEKPDVVVSYSMWENEDMVFADGVKTVKYIHGDAAIDPDYRDDTLKNLDRIRRFDRIICVSQSACENFKKLTGIVEPVRMLYNPIRAEHVRSLAAQPVELPEDLPIVCAVGRLYADKGFERLIILHRRLLDQGIRHWLVIVGDGPQWESLGYIIEATGTQDTVIRVGYQSNPYPYMAKARVVVNSSYVEGLPVIAAEALCLGVPVVAPVPSVQEIFGGEFCGLVTENSTMALEEGIRRMLTEDDLYERAKEGARRRGDYLATGHLVQEVEKMFLELVDEG